jgi:hypothetical protein
MCRTRISAALLLVTVAICRDGFAGDVALAESLFRQGRALMDKGDYSTACVKLSESFSQDPATGTLLALAVCQDRAGQTASAWATYADVVARAKREGQFDREQAARQRLEALEPKLSHLTVELDPAIVSLQGLALRRDGVAIGRGAWGVSAPVDPGEHLVEVTAPGKITWKTTVKVGLANDVVTVTVPPLADEPPALSREPARDVPQTPKEESGVSPLRIVGLSMGGVGLVGLGLSAYFGLHGDSKSDGHCDASNGCDRFGIGKRNDAVSASNAATISLIAGGVLAAAGVTCFFIGGPKDANRGEVSVQVTPAIAPGAGAMVVRGRF